MVSLRVVPRAALSQAQEETNKSTENMADNTDMPGNEERITKLIKKVFEDEFQKQEQNLVA